MTLRRFAPVALALGALACLPEVSQNTNPAFVDFAAFDPSTGDIPIPNDLALLSVPTAACAAPLNAQVESICMLQAAGGFPNDQEVPISFGFVRVPTAGGATGAPDLDVASLKFCGIENGVPKLVPNCNVLFLRVDQALPEPVDDRTVELAYTRGAAGGTLVLRSKPDPGTGSRKWPAGARYVVALRAGPSGVKTVGGGTVSPQPTMYLLLQDRNLLLPENQGLIPGTPREKAEAGAQLETLRQGYALPQGGAPLSVFGLVDSAFPHREIADLTTFKVAPFAGNQVVMDASASVVPLPSDFLLDPATGNVRAGIAPGLENLDGFSTTAMIIAQTARPISANTVTNATVSLWEYTATGPKRVFDVVDQLTTPANTATYVTEPSPITQDLATGQPCVAPYAATCVAPLIGLQPAVPAPVGPSLLTLPPLKETTEYAVLITTGVKDAPAPIGTGNGIVPGTTAKILLFTNPLAVNGTSQVPGIDDATAAGLEAMRQALGPVRTAAGVAKNQVAMAYTFRTQTITGRKATTAGGGTGPSGSIQIASLPYTPVLAGVCAALGASLTPPVTNLDCTKPLPGSLVVYTATGTGGTNVDDAFAKYGMDLAVPHAAIQTIYEAKIATIDLLDDATGAFGPPAGAKPEVVTVLVAVGDPASMPTCAGPLAGLAPAKCPPLVLFHHGLGGSKSYMLAVADTLAAAGNLVVAIDMAKHGERSYCNVANPTGNPDAECAAGVCVPEPALANQGDPTGKGPGFCRATNSPTAPRTPFLNKASLCFAPGTVGVPGSTCAVVNGTPITLDPTTGFPNNLGFPAASGEYLLTSNFFRARDTFRQTIIDATQVLQVLAPTPSGLPITGHLVYNDLLAKGVFVDPFRTFWLGQSLGSIVGGINVASNPRLSRAVFNVGGATFVDLGFNSPSFKSVVDPLLAGLGIDRTNPADAAAYLQVVTVAKWVLDPADPVNFAGHLTADPLPNLLPPLGGAVDGSVAQAPKQVLAQHAICDQTVQNPFNAEYAGVAGLSPTLPPAAPGALGTVQWFLDVNGPAVADVYPGSGCAAGMRVPHGFLASWGAGLAGADFTSIQGLTLAAQSDAAAFLDTGTTQETLVVR